jgi:hypothetical protein
MSSPPQPPPPLHGGAFSPSNTGPEGEKDAPRQGRLAGGNSSNLTRGGNTRVKFTPKAIGRKAVDKYFYFVEYADISTTNTPKETPAAPAERNVSVWGLFEN